MNNPSSNILSTDQLFWQSNNIKNQITLNTVTQIQESGKLTLVPLHQKQGYQIPFAQGPFSLQRSYMSLQHPYNFFMLASLFRKQTAFEQPETRKHISIKFKYLAINIPTTSNPT